MCIYTLAHSAPQSALCTCSFCYGIWQQIILDFSATLLTFILKAGQKIKIVAQLYLSDNTGFWLGWKQGPNANVNLDPADIFYSSSGMCFILACIIHKKCIFQHISVFKKMSMMIFL